MSYYFALWQGPVPLSNAHATSECDRLLAERSNHPPTPGIACLVEALRYSYPEGPSASAGGQDPAWSNSPIASYVDGPVAYIPVRPELASQARPVLQRTAESCELIAFDPQLGELIPSATTVPRFSDFAFPAAEVVPVHLVALIGEALGAGVGLAGILEQVSTGYYVQWMAKDGSLTVEAQGDHLLAPALRLDSEGRREMISVGFVESEPNWRLHWDDGFGHLDQAGQILGHVLTTVRRLPVGEAMSLHTFPV